MDVTGHAWVMKWAQVNFFFENWAQVNCLPMIDYRCGLLTRSSAHQSMEVASFENSGRVGGGLGGFGPSSECAGH